MTKENPGPKPASVVTGSDKDRSDTGRGTSTSHVARRPVSKESEAIIKDVSVRRRTAMKVLANR